MNEVGWALMTTRYADDVEEGQSTTTAGAAERPRQAMAVRLRIDRAFLATEAVDES